ncbi:MAG: hypothetical protein J0I12_31125 [Candidatus Eremiobacteraeota bacterium]|nr:hypothetical protein [Candidatus Eremiobacteraeota bacterium]
MQPVSQGVSSLDLQKLRQQNEDSLQTRATQQLGAELKAGSKSGVSKEEKLTAGQDDQVDLTAAQDKSTRSSSKTASPDSTVASNSAPPASSETSAKSTPSETAPETSSSPEMPADNGSQSPAPDPQKPLYSDDQLAFANRLRELEDQRKTLQDMWRKLYMDWMADQMQAAEDMENFRQTTGLLWTDVCTSRWIQGARHAEAMRSLL